MKAYLVSRGEYSLYLLIAICSTKEKAQEIIDKVNKVKFPLDYEAIFVEYEMDEIDQDIITIIPGLK